MKPKAEKYGGSSIELREEKGEQMLMVNGEQLRYGRLPDGKYFLHDYAYDWTDDLMELGKKYIDYKAKAEKARPESEARQKEDTK